MNLKAFLTRFVFFFTLIGICGRSIAHDIYFCGEKIPLDDTFVAQKLMDIIKRQINLVNMRSLRDSIKIYMPQVERYLQQANLPQDLKYLAIVESGFKTNVKSPVGALGFWQLMPNTGKDWGLVVNDMIDERTDFDKSTMAACREIARNYLSIRKAFNISSWVLTAAAYNVGIGRIKNAIKNKGNNYFTMNLNPETAAYVYKIIAVKELFEFPELYMKNFGRNVFTAAPSSKDKKLTDQADVTVFGNMKVDVNEADGAHPVDLNHGKIKSTISTDAFLKAKFVFATIKGKYKHIHDGDVVNFVLQDELKVKNIYTFKNATIGGTAWIIDGRVMINLGYNHDVVLTDLYGEKGIALSNLKNKQPVVLKVLTPAGH